MLAKLRPAKKQKQPRGRRENASVSPGTYVYREPLGVLQISEYFVGREGYAFVHGVTTCASVKSNTFRHGRQGLDAACVTWLRHRGRPIRRHVRGFRGPRLVNTLGKQKDHTPPSIGNYHFIIVCGYSLMYPDFSWKCSTLQMLLWHFLDDGLSFI